MATYGDAHIRIHCPLLLMTPLVGRKWFAGKHRNLKGTDDADTIVRMILTGSHRVEPLQLFVQSRGAVPIGIGMQFLPQGFIGRRSRHETI